MGPTWGSSGPCRPQMGPMLAPWTGIVVFCCGVEPFEFTYTYPSGPLFTETTPSYWYNDPHYQPATVRQPTNLMHTRRSMVCGGKKFMNKSVSLEFSVESNLWYSNIIWNNTCQPVCCNCNFALKCADYILHCKCKRNWIIFLNKVVLTIW